MVPCGQTGHMTLPPGRLTCQACIHSFKGVLYFGHLSLAFAIPGSAPLSLCVVGALSTGPGSMSVRSVNTPFSGQALIQRSWASWSRRSEPIS